MTLTQDTAHKTSTKDEAERTTDHEQKTEDKGQQTRDKRPRTGQNTTTKDEDKRQGQQTKGKRRKAKGKSSIQRTDDTRHKARANDKGRSQRTNGGHAEDKRQKSKDA